MAYTLWKLIGKDIMIGARIIRDAALSKKFADASGKYFDNDNERFRPPHPDGENKQKCDDLVNAIEGVLTKLGCGQSCAWNQES